MGCCTSKGESPYSQRGDFYESPQKSRGPSHTISSIRESYNIIKALGSGTLGSVYLVKDKRSGLERAAKELVKALMDTSKTENFFRELSILRNIVKYKQDHPSIMKVYEVVETSTRIYIITEYYLLI